MVLSAMFVLISQALGMEILDAYTIRKILPRILVAAIGLTLSWTLMRFFVQFTDDLGFGIRNLIEFPFRNLSGQPNLSILNGDVAAPLAGLVSLPWALPQSC